MPTESDLWMRGYALQALSDLHAREALVNARAKKCHRLHFLQMAAEKTCEAHLAGGHGNVRKSRACVEKTLPAIARQFYAKVKGNSRIAAWNIAEIRRSAREIQLLAPACGDGEFREDNGEYPWNDGKGTSAFPANTVSPTSTMEKKRSSG